MYPRDCSSKHTWSLLRRPKSRLRTGRSMNSVLSPHITCYLRNKYVKKKKVKASLLNFLPFAAQGNGEQQLIKCFGSFFKPGAADDEGGQWISGCPVRLLECLTNVFLASERFSDLLFLCPGLASLVFKTGLVTQHRHTKTYRNTHTHTMPSEETKP